MVGCDKRMRRSISDAQSPTSLPTELAPRSFNAIRILRRTGSAMALRLRSSSWSERLMAFASMVSFNCSLSIDWDRRNPGPLTAEKIYAFRGQRPAGTGTKDEAGRQVAAGPVAHPEVAGPAVRIGARF